jgi:HAD superfamily hydrolase (TIGR01509 family)
MAITASPATSTRAVFFDIDGTLIDSNYLHVEAWAHAFSDLGLSVDESDIHALIGMDAGELLAKLLGDDADEFGDRAKELHTSYYESLVPRLRVMEGAREILEALSARGVSVVLATSAPESELVHLRELLDAEKFLAAVTSGEDVSTAKPDPGIVSIALERAGSAPENTIMVGDAVWDVIAAKRAGVECIAVQTGGTSRAELEEAGAIAVYASVAELLESLDQSPLARLYA